MSGTAATESSCRPKEPTTTAAVVCTHNGGRFIEEQLDSIDGQTHPVDEIHIFDWASHDDTLARIRDWISRNDRRRGATTVHSMDSAPGPAQSFLHALRHVVRNSAVALLFIADQDDLWAPEKVRTFVREYEGDPTFDLAFSDVSVVRYPDGKRFGSFYGERSPYKRPTFVRDRTVLLTNPAIGMTMCVRRGWLESVLPAFDFYWVMHDWALLILSWLTGNRLRFIDEPLVVYRQHERNLLGASFIRPPLAKLRTIRTHVRNVRRQLTSAREVARITSDSQIKEEEIAVLQGRLAQVLSAVRSPILTLKYRLLLAVSLLVF